MAKASKGSDVTQPSGEKLDFDNDNLRAIAEVYKNEGNDEYRKKEYSNAIHFYTEGIKVSCGDDELNAKLYNNRATAHFCCGNYQESLNDARAAFILQPTYTKAIARGVSACVELGLYEEAIAWCDKGLTINKNDKMLLDLRSRSFDLLNTLQETKHEKMKGELESLTLKDQMSGNVQLCKDGEDRYLEERTHCKVGDDFYRRGEFRKAIYYHEKYLKFTKQVKDRSGEGRVCGNLGNDYYSLGNFKTAIDYHERCLKITKELGDRVGEGRAHGNLGSIFQSLGNFKRALDNHERCLSIAKDVGDRIGEESAYGNLGIVYSSLGDFKKAINYHENCLKLIKEEGNRSKEGIVHCNLGIAYCSVGDFKKAICCYESCLIIAKESEDRAEEGRAYGSLGNAFHGLGDFKRAIDYHERSLKIAEEFKDKAREGSAHCNLGNAHHACGNYKKAIDYHERHLKIAKEIEARIEEGRAYGNLGNDYHNLGDFKKAIDHHILCLKIAQELEVRYDEGRANNSLGSAFYKLGDLKQAVDYHECCLKIVSDIGDRSEEGRACGYLGNVHKSMGNFTKAIDYHERSLKIAKEVGDRAAEGCTFGSLGNDYSAARNFKKAIKCHESCLKIAKEVGDRSEEGRANGNLGNAYYSLGDFEKAIVYYEHCLKIAKEIGRRADEGNAFGNLGNAYSGLGDYKKSVEYQERCIEIAKEVEDKAAEGIVYGNLGSSYVALGSLQKAVDCYQSSVRALNDVRARLQSKDEWKINLRDVNQDSYTALWRILLKLDRSIEALCAAEKGRAQALNDLLESNYGILTADTGSSTEEEAGQDIFKDVPCSTVFLAFGEGVIHFWVIQNGGEICKRVKEVDDPGALDDAINSVQKLVENTFADIGVRSEVSCQDCSLDERGKTSFATESSDQTRSASQRSQNQRLRRLYDVIIDPIADLIHGDKLIIVPEGPLWLVPYAALMDSNSKYLYESFKLRVIPSLKSLKLIMECRADYHSKIASETGSLLVGDPCLQGALDDRGERLAQLPSARKEVERVGQILNTSPLIGKEATKDEVLKRLPSASLVHFAAHGRRNTGEIHLAPNPLRTSHVPKEEDYLLTMADVLAVKLQARLVVLSCCHSGRGEIKSEGVVGIARAFLGVGARSVLVSLWAIDDDATLELMKSFYEHLVEGTSASEALNRAMKSMRESEEYSEVKYWAPFVLIGDDVTLKFGGRDC